MRRLGPYEVLSQLGAGGRGAVYRAHDPRLGRDIALKVIRRARVADAGAEEGALEHPQPLAFGLLFSTIIHLARREPAEVCRVFEELSVLCRTHGIAQELQWGAPLRGRALVELGQIDRGMEELKDGLAAHTLTRSALLRAKRFDEAQEALTESHAVADATSQHAYDAEHRRLQAELLLAQGDLAGTERVYLDSLEIARAQGARWYQLRSSRGYARFLIRFGRAEEAKTVLEICDAITEGRETHDFVYAEALARTLDAG